MTVLSLPILPLQELISMRQSADYRQNCIEFLGSPRKHPSDSSRLILVTGVLENQKIFLEFRKEDIRHVDESKTLANLAGENVRMVSLWIEKGSVAIELRPFKVE
jgi:inorganic pyrophosphatase